MVTTRETLVVFGDGSRENNCIKEEVCGMLYQIKYLLKGVKPLSNQELKKISVRTSQIKKEIGHLGATFDEDVKKGLISDRLCVELLLVKYSDSGK